MNKIRYFITSLLGIIVLTGAGCSYNAPSEGQNIVYSNSTYGFTLTLPQTWEGYTTKNRTLDWGTFGTSDSIDFSMSPENVFFNVSAHSKSQWGKIQAEEGPIPTYLGENSQYIFGYSAIPDETNDKILVRMAEIKEIVKTFSLTEE